MRVRVNYRIEIRTESRSIDPSGVSGRIRDVRASHEATALDRSQLPDRRAVSAHYDRAPRLHLTEYGAGLVTKLSLRDGADFHAWERSTS